MMKNNLLIIRFLINPISFKILNPNPLISSSPTLTPSINTSIHNPNQTCPHHRFFSIIPHDNKLISNQHAVTRTKFTNSRNPKLVSEIIDIVKSSNGECRSKLDSIDTKLNKVSICEIIRVLSFEKVLALKFFKWVRDNNPDVYRNGDVCSLMVDNCGWLNDFDTMKDVLKEFRHEMICVNENAFGFLPVLDSSKAKAMESVASVVKVLDEVGGSVRGSGVHGLITMLCETDCFELAKYVMEITEKKVNYYAVLVREKCKRGNAEEAHGLINEMRVNGCEPGSKIYNYVLSCLCKTGNLSGALRLLEEMKEAGVDPDEITYEIFVSSACKRGSLGFANECFDKLLQTGRVPRVSTYAAMVKGYFNAGRYDEAYAYVCDLEVKRVGGVHKMFSLLAGLHMKKADVHAAARILGEMMKKGLKPDFLYYAKTVNCLRSVGSKDLALDLKKKFSEFRVE